MTFPDEAFATLRELRAAHAPGAELWLTELAEDSGRGCKEGICDTMAGALWTADILGRLAENDADAVLKFVFKSGEDHRFNLLDHELKPRPSYFVYWLLSREYGDRILETSTSRGPAIGPDVGPGVAAHASLREDGSLALLLVNKAEEAHAVEVDVDGFVPSRYRAFDIVGDSYSDTEVEVNGVRLDASNVHEGVPAETRRWTGQLEVPAHAVRLLVLEPEESS